MSKLGDLFRTSGNVLRLAYRWFLATDDVHVEAAKGNLANLKALLARRPELVNLVDRMDSGTPLHWAATWGQSQASEVLLSHGADPNLADRCGHTPLYWAIRAGEAGIVRLLLDQGAKANVEGEDGQTPLDCAIAYKQDEIATMLRNQGAVD